MSAFCRASIVLLALGLAVPALAADPGVDTTSVRVTRSPNTRTLERRIAAAASYVCGASPFSAAEVKAAIARSQCWRDSYAAGIVQIGGGSPADVASLPAPRTMGEP